MSSIKCKSCGLTNFASEPQCRRCGGAFTRPQQREKAPRSFSLTSLLIPAIAAVGFYYFFVGSGSSAGEVTATNANRTASQTTQPEPSGESRMVLERQRANHIGNTLNVNPSLDAHQKRVADSQKMM